MRAVRPRASHRAADVQAEVGDREHSLEEAPARAERAVEAGDVAGAEAAEAEASRHAEDLARLRVADAARRDGGRPRRAGSRGPVGDGRTSGRGLAERIPVTDAEVAAAAAQPRESSPIDPDVRAQWKAEQAAEREAYRQAEADKWAERMPVTDAELERHAELEAERTEAEAEAGDEASLAEVRAELDRVGELIDQIPDRQAEQRAQREQEAEAGPGYARRRLRRPWRPRGSPVRPGAILSPAPAPRLRAPISRWRC